MLAFQKLITYQQSEEIYDLTIAFCNRFIDRRSRTHDQMVQAARSGKQNIVEGATQKTSMKGYIKLVGVARGSLGELLEDYWDFARTHGLSIYPRGHEKVEMVKRMEKEKRKNFLFSSPSSPSFSSQPSVFPSQPSILLVSYLIDLITRTNYLLDRQRKALEEKFVQEGGYSENLFKRRLQQR